MILQDNALDTASMFSGLTTGASSSGIQVSTLATSSTLIYPSSGAQTITSGCAGSSSGYSSACMTLGFLLWLSSWTSPGPEQALR